MDLSKIVIGDSTNPFELFNESASLVILALLGNTNNKNDIRSTILCAL